MHECLEQCKYYKKVKNPRKNNKFCPLCTYGLENKGIISAKIGYRGIPSKKISTIPPFWCPLRKIKIPAK